MSIPEIYQLFVYGSLRSGFRSPAYEYISNFFSLVGDAKVKGKLFDMGDYPAALPVNENTFITGELYRINHVNEFAWSIGQLDDYEGVASGTGEIPLYRRELTEVFINDKVTQAWIYWFNGDVSGRTLIVSGDLIQYMQEKK